MKLVIIGGGAAGATAAFEARKFNQEIEIMIFSCDKYTHYSPCGLPFVISGRVPNISDLIVYPPSLYKMSEIDLRLETEVLKLCPEDKIIKTSSKEVKYDKLIIATGSLPVIPPIRGVQKDGIYTLKGIDDAKRILAGIKEVRQVVVVGAGLIGLEMACAFRSLGIEVKVVEKEDRPLPYLLDEDMADELRRHLEKEGIEFYFGKKVEEILGKGKVKAISLGKEEIPCMFVLLACGTKPNIELAKEAGIELGKTGRIKVDAKMQTSHKDIYAAGDCAETVHFLTNKPVQSMSMLGSTATRQGKVAAVNAVGKSMRFSGSLNTTITELMGLEVGSVGLNIEEAKEEGFEPVAVTFEGSSRDTFFPGGERIVLKMIADQRTAKVLGMQIIGKDGVFARVLAVSFAIQQRMDVEELACAETAYVPSLSPTFDPITLTAEMLLRKMG